MVKESLEIGIALSGGGIRAGVFHLGMLCRLANEDLLQNVKYISTVSGGSIITGLVYNINDNCWPSNIEFIEKVLPKVKYYLTRTDIEKALKINTIFKFWFWFGKRANLLSECLKKHWDINGLISELEKNPRWIINATTYESGKNWRFMPERMGDYVLNYSEFPNISISDAMAASAAFPILIDLLEINTSNYEWFEFDLRKNKKKTKIDYKNIHLWDGGVYDNLGVESLFKPNKNVFRDGINFLLVSDGSRGIYSERFKRFNFFAKTLRLTYIILDQIRSLRSRMLVKHFQEHYESGVYLKMGNTTKYILQQAGFDSNKISDFHNSSLNQEEIFEVENFPTTLRKLTEREFNLIFRHGWEVTNFTLISRCPNMFKNLEYPHEEKVVSI